MRRLASRGAAYSPPSPPTTTTLCAGVPIRVRSRGGVPVHIEWRGHLLSVATIEYSWCVQGRWWQDRDRLGEKRRYFRLHLSLPSGLSLCVEVFHARGSDASAPPEWRLWRVAD